MEKLESKLSLLEKNPTHCTYRLEATQSHKIICLTVKLAFFTAGYHPNLQANHKTPSQEHFQAL